MSLKAQAVKNVTATWFGLVVHAIVGFFLSPFILHRLGDEAFSVWILVFALTGYYGLLDLGIRSSIVRYTARFAAIGDSDQLSRYLSTSIAFYILVALVVFLATAVGYVDLGSLFRIPARLLQPARILFALAGASVALTFPLGVFAGVLEGLQKFAWLQLSQVGIALLRAVLILMALMHGGGLIAIGIVTVGMSLLGYLIFAGMALHVLPARLSVHYVDSAAFRKMATYGFFAFAILAAEKLRFQSDAMVIGAFLSATAITSFSIAAKLVEYSSYAVRSMSQIFTPLSSQFHAEGDSSRLQRTFIAGNRACALITFPLCATLIILGRSIIESWVGARYVTSYSALIVLVIPRSLYLAQSTSTRILLGMGRHRLLASVLLVEGAANLLLSLLLVRPYGIVGVALGTAIPLACTSLFFLPLHLCRVLDLPPWPSLSRAYGLPLLVCAPFAATLWLVNREFPAHTYVGVLLQVACGGVAYCLALGCALWNGGVRRPRSWQAFAQLLESK